MRRHSNSNLYCNECHMRNTSNEDCYLHGNSSHPGQSYCTIGCDRSSLSDTGADRHEVCSLVSTGKCNRWMQCNRCLLYTSDAADERTSVDIGVCRIIKKK